MLTSAELLQCICKDTAFGLLDVCICQCLALAEQPLGFDPLPIMSSQVPKLLEPRASILTELSMLAARRSAPAGITEPEQLFAMGAGSTVLIKSQLIYFYCSLYTCTVFLYINYSSLPS